jgi:hypothetical protein
MAINNRNRRHRADAVTTPPSELWPLDELDELDELDVMGEMLAEAMGQPRKVLEASDPTRQPQPSTCP